MTRAPRKLSVLRRFLAELRWWFGWTLRRLPWLIIGGGLLFILWQRDVFDIPIAAIAPTSETAFDRWMAEDNARRVEFQQFEGFLTEQGVAGVVPTWQLMRIDAVYAGRCNLDVWHMPPRDLWPNIVPALRLVRDHVVPTVGEVEVQSSWRSPELNDCARGAARSRHIRFQALDLLASERPDDLAGFYGQLCAMQARAGRASGMGLGAYYDPSDPAYNQAGRFHIDAEGYRSWGRSYTSATSPCPAARYLSPRNQ